MLAHLCRTKAMEGRVEETMPSGSAFLADASMKYVRIKSSSLGYYLPLQYLPFYFYLDV
jgi:hypothetical protein